MGKKSEWSTLMPFLCSSPRTTPRKVRDDRGRLQKLFLDYICKRVTQDNICNSWNFYNCLRVHIIFCFAGEMVDCQYIRNNLSLLHQCSAVFFCCLSLYKRTSTRRSKKWCLITCDVEITWKLYSIWMSFVLCSRMRHPWLLFRTCIKLNPHFVCPSALYSHSPRKIPPKIILCWNTLRSAFT